MTIRTEPFYPALNYAVVTTGASSTPQAIAQPSTPAGVATGKKYAEVVLVNISTSAVGIAWNVSSTGTATASIGGLTTFIVAPSSTYRFRVPDAPYSLATQYAISTATGTTYIAVGEGGN